MISHGSWGRVLSDKLIGEIRRQLGGLSRRQLEQFIDCPLSQEDFEAYSWEHNVL